MNLTDFEAPEYTPEALNNMIARQASLMHRYHAIEEANGFRPVGPVPVSLHDRFGQAVLKDFAWRITEELAEALEFDHCLNENYKYIHFVEELMDALHFLLELMILADAFQKPLPPNLLQDVMNSAKYEVEPLSKDFTRLEVDFLRVKVWGVVQSLGLAMNCLKNKPWKQTHLLTDETKFRVLLNSTLIHLLQVCSLAGLKANDVHDFYFRKSEVNRFRQRSNY